MDELIERLHERAEFEDKRVLDEAKAMGFEPEVYTGSQTGALLREAAAALEAAREDAERAMDGLRYAALVWVLSNEIEQSPETVDSAVRRMIRGGAKFRSSGHRAFPAIDQARGKAGGEVEGG